MLNQNHQAPQYSPAIVRAGEQDIPAICKILEMAAQWLAAREMHNWHGFYTTERVSQYFHDCEIYIVHLNSEIVATVTLNATEDEPGWYLGSPAMYVNALAVSPLHHSHGIGSSLLRYAEDVARQRGYGRVRLDTVEDFHWLNVFYKKRGYEVVGDVQRRFRYLQYEKKLDGAGGLDNKT